MKTRRVVFLFLMVILVGCTPSGLMETPQETDGASTKETPMQISQDTPSPAIEETNGNDFESATLTPTATPTPFLQVESQFKLLPAGYYLVYYDHELNSLVALSFQLTQSVIASGSEVFLHSNNVLFAQVDQALVNLAKDSVTDIPVLEQPGCEISSISLTGTGLAAYCEDGGVYLYWIGEAWEKLFSEDYIIERPVFSPDDEQLAFCLKNSTEVYQSGLYRIQLNECRQNEDCEFTLVTSPCEELFYAWSPDANKMVVASKDTGFQKFEFVLGSKTELAAMPQGTELKKMVWSPDGRWITFSSSQIDGNENSSAIYLMDVQVQEPRLFFESDHPIELIGWLNVISPFKMGNNYVVLPSENQYWLKDSPNKEAFNLKLLVAGEKVRVLKQYELVGGEKWWQVRVGDYIGWVKEDPLHFQNDWMYGLGSPVFETGRRLIVKLSGNDLRLREMPSLNGAVKRFLQPGIKLKILDGPAVVDRYNWWLVEIEGSKIYGWVVEEALWYASDE